MADYHTRKKVEKRKEELAIEELDKKIKYLYFQSTINKEGKRETLAQTEYLSGRVVKERNTWDV